MLWQIIEHKYCIQTYDMIMKGTLGTCLSLQKVLTNTYIAYANYELITAVFITTKAGNIA